MESKEKSTVTIREGTHLDNEGLIIIEPVYDFPSGSFHEGLARVAEYDKNDLAAWHPPAG